MDPGEVEKATVDQILNTIVDGMRADYPPEMTLAAVTAMCNSLDFTEANFEVQGERDAIMNSVCQAAQCPVVAVREKAFECLATIAAFYYSKLPPYVTNLFQLTVNAIKTDVEEVGQQAIEFWSTVCDTETEYADDETCTSFNVIAQASPSLIPVILETLSKQSEDADEESWNIAKAGAACLDAISQTIEDAVVPHVLPFVTAGIQSSEWRVKESAIMAFGMILDGPDSKTLTPIVTGALPVLVQCLQDPSTHVKDTCAWVIGRICEFHTSAITPAIFPHMVTALTLCLDDQSSGVASQACFAVHNLAMACEEQADDKTNVLSSFMPTMLQKLLNVVNREDWDENNLRSTAYEAVNKMVENSAEDMLQVVGQVLDESCTRLEKTFNDNMEQQERMTLQANLCSLIGVCINKLPEENVKQYSDRIMQSVLMVFNTKGSVAHEDAFLAIGYLSGKLEEEFGSRYVQFLMPPLLLGMQNTEEYAVCLVAVGVAGDLCRALGKGIAPYADEIMRCTLEILRSESVNRYVYNFVDM